ncbi:hypothetical protein HYH03_008877 [Edaphochlamys debaryana]|uniref:Ferredoxin n=1 Tax=Edaphochlamys debaryana TaxID=47281 RepID=A0A836BXW7_9CHLO|nr:hypothetical protein HYH03_008877 [Edaphochlamys debaryana]|eukprot:KAG2492970.1 hypothetical protein HYH03_008877 [Edaphochlamys debaryana]
MFPFLRRRSAETPSAAAKPSPAAASASGPTAAGAMSAAVAGTSAGAPAGTETKGGHPHHGEHMAACIENCRGCEKACLDTIPHCLGAGGHHARPDHILMLMASGGQGGGRGWNCAHMCATSARFMISGSRMHTYTCAACAEVCDACADDCCGMLAAAGQGGGGDTQAAMERCAEACRACAKTCRSMASGACC